MTRVRKPKDFILGDKNGARYELGACLSEPKAKWVRLAGLLFTDAEETEKLIRWLIRAKAWQEGEK